MDKLNGIELQINFSDQDILVTGKKKIFIRLPYLLNKIDKSLSNALNSFIGLTK